MMNIENKPVEGKHAPVFRVCHNQYRPDRVVGQTNAMRRHRALLLQHAVYQFARYGIAVLKKSNIRAHNSCCVATGAEATALTHSYKVT